MGNRPSYGPREVAIALEIGREEVTGRFIKWHDAACQRRERC